MKSQTTGTDDLAGNAKSLHPFGTAILYGVVKAEISDAQGAQMAVTTNVPHRT